MNLTKSSSRSRSIERICCTVAVFCSHHKVVVPSNVVDTQAGPPAGRRLLLQLDLYRLLIVPNQVYCTTNYMQMIVIQSLLFNSLGKSPVSLLFQASRDIESPRHQGCKKRTKRGSSSKLKQSYKVHSSGLSKGRQQQLKCF